MPTAAKTGINTPAIVAAREAYAARFETLSEALAGVMFAPRLQHQPATEWKDLPTEDSRLLAEVESAYEAAKDTWTGRSWEDGDKVTPESTDDQIASMLTRREPLAVTCWGVDESDERHRRRVNDALSSAIRAWSNDMDNFSAACDRLRELAEESDAGVAERAAVAETDAAQAIKEARAGNKHSALVHAEHAAKVEREFGDAPTWGPFCEAMRAWSEHDAE